MATSTINRESWDSLSSTFTNLDVSFSQDSCYGSDEVSVSSNTTAPLHSSAATPTIKSERPNLQPFLKSILKNSRLEEECDSESDSESESGYGSDEIEYDYDALSEDESDEDDDMSDFSIWEETSQDVPEVRQDHTDSFDDSFIGFEAAVHFSPSVQYIDTPEYTEDEEECSDSQMTVHEMMLLSLQSGGSQGSLIQSDAEEVAEHDCDHKEFVRNDTRHPEEYTPDGVDLDCNLFVALMNGIHGIADHKYKSYLRLHVDSIRLGQETEPMHPDDPPCMYLDSIVAHVVGIFRNLLAVDELDGLVALRNEDICEHASETKDSENSPTLHLALLTKIEHLLQDRLASGRVDISPDELSFLAGGIAHALGTRDLPASATA
ncbi:hypothetical protein PENSTE_c007G02981 [Penicillium steckii]|uniref:Uncharacterized protein n=1 Tax=Penicillium steckii TaxID=303698 RepID=A0A1V6TFZ9_9EURO|nr:hypothetical protein PENSTE_c007G02981 [Penicillium steckii]